jgi:hypothetical protein
MSIRSIFNLLTVALVVATLAQQPLSAQDLFKFPDDDPIVGDAKQDLPQEVNPLAGARGAQDVQDPLIEDDPLLREDDLTVRPTQPGRQPGAFQMPGDEDERPGQVVVLNSKFAGWQQAGPGAGGKRLSNEIRANWVMVNSNGRFTGQVVPGTDVELGDMVVHLMSMGRQIKEAKVDRNGFFEFSNVAEGPYSLIGWSESAFFAFGLIVLDYNEQDISKVRNNVRVIATQNKTTLNTDWIRHYSPKVAFRVFGRYREPEGMDDPQHLYGVDGLSANLPNAQPATSIDSRPVERTTSGGVLGRVHQMNSQTGRPVDVRGTRVLLLQDDDVVAATDTDNYGVFYFPFVEVGQYGLLAAGVDGVGMIGVDIIDAKNNVLMNEVGEIVRDEANAPVEPFPFDFCMVSAETVGWLNHSAVELAYRRNLLAPRKPSPDEQNRVCAGCNGGGCQHCQGTGLCKSRCQSFEDWAANCLGQEQRTKLGSGYILSEASKDLRRIVNRGNQYFENAFYGDQAGGLNPQQYGNQDGFGYPNGYWDPNANSGMYNYGGSGNQFAPTPAQAPIIGSGGGSN